MAYSFPLSLTDFFDILPVQSMTFDFPEAAEVSKTQGGDLLTASLGTRLWQGKVTLDKMVAARDAEVMAMLDVARRPGASIMISDRKRPWPRADFGGALLGAAAPKLGGISTDTRELSLYDLPAGYQLMRGDMIGFAYASNPVRYALHRVASGAIADGSGVTGMMEVSPNIRAGAAVGAPVTLLNPACKAIIVPGSVDVGTRKRTLTTGVSFQWLQTLR